MNVVEIKNVSKQFARGDRSPMFSGGHSAIFHLACRSTARGEVFIDSYQTVSSVPSASSIVLG